MNNWQHLRQLSWTQRWLLVQAALMLPLTTLALWLLGFGSTRSVLAVLAPIDSDARNKQARSYVDQAHATARIVNTAARHSPFRANCLEQSLVLWWLLRRQDIESELRFGVRKRTDRFEAHAWVHFRDAPLNDHRDIHQRFVPLVQPREARLK